MVSLPRLVIAAANSSAGKTTIATGLMAALRASGHEVAGFKVGPDFIDPGYHALATGRPGRNLDPVLTSDELVPQLLLHGARVPRRADIALIEGVMGLFDGRLGRDGFGSTAHVARLVDAPVLLVVDAAGSSRTAAAAALGLRGFDERIRIAGVVVNRVASPRHAAELAGVFEAAGLPRTPPPQNAIVFDTSLAMMEAVLQGAGVGLAPPLMFSRLLSSGDVVQPFRTSVTLGSYWLTRLQSRAVTPAMSAFAAWLEAAVVEEGLA